MINLRVKEICKTKSITIGELAVKMNPKMTRESLSRAINGNPTLETLEKIATALEVEISELFSDNSDLYGVVIYHGKTYKINSRQAVEDLYNLVK
jgi:transcriptional regulator with XRE-family HTH domain